MSSLWEPWEERTIKSKIKESIWGTPEIVKTGLEKLINRTNANEIMINSWIHNPDKKIKSYELISKIWGL